MGEGMGGGIAQPVACQSGAARGAWSCRNVMRRHSGIVTERERLDVRLPPCQDLVARIGLNSTNPNLAPYESTETCKPHKKVLWRRKKKGDFIHWHARARTETALHRIKKAETSMDLFVNGGAGTCCEAAKSHLSTVLLSPAVLGRTYGRQSRKPFACFFSNSSLAHQRATGM